MNVTTHLVSSLAKIFPNEDFSARPKYSGASALRGERFAFQMAYRYTEGWGGMVRAETESDLNPYIELRRSELAPVLHAGYSFDDDVLGREPGLYPDVLFPCDGDFRLAPNQWRTIWITVNVPKDLKPGKYKIKVRVFMPAANPVEESLGEETFTLEVLDAVLPDQELIVTHWFHADCIAVQYGVPVFSEAHWKLLDAYFKSFAAHGSNMLLTPVFTPPLDTAVGGERPTTQLVKVTVTKGKYSFDLTQLDRWIKLAKKNGVKYFEISHLFTQWGAAFCPKVIATVDGKEKRIFGWDVASDSREYTEFLDAFLPELVKFLKARRLQKCTFFHCSDEPGMNHIEMYRKAVTILRKHTAGFRVCDALSNVEFYKNGLVTTPIPAENHIEPFVEAGVKPLWSYYCCGQVDKVSNRFLHMPSSRNRIMGSLLYRYDCEGFLQWGFNFWYSCLSLHPVDVYADTSSDYAFPPGDGFMVYPGRDGKPVESIHHEVFSEGIQDLRALRLLESMIGRAKVAAMLDKLSPGGKMTMTEYPRGEEAVLALRGKINSLIRKHAAKA